MKKKYIISLFFCGYLCCFPVNAKRGFFVGIDFQSSNVWTSTGINLIEGLVNTLIKDAYFGDVVAPMIGNRTTYDIMKFTDDNRRVVFNNDDWHDWRTFCRFRTKDLFGHIVGNAKFGWMGEYSPIGAYAFLGYDYRNFSMRLSYQSESLDYRIGTLRPGLGIRISPANFYDSDAACKFIIEFGTNYNARVNFKGPYDNDKSQLNGGLSYIASVGLSAGYCSILLGFEWANHDLFNRSYTPDDGLFYPYYNLSSKIMSVCICVNYGF